MSVALVKTVPSINPRIAVYLPEETKKRLEVIAHKERRSLSQMALILIEKGLGDLESETTKSQK